MSRPVVAAVIKSFPPAFRSGGPGRSVSSIVELLGGELDFRVLTSIDDNGHDLSRDGVTAGRWERRDGAEVLALPRSIPLASWRLVRELRRLRPDVLYLNTFFHPVFGLTPLIARRLGLLRPCRVVLAPRGELTAGALGLKSRKKRRMLGLVRRFGLVDGVVWQATSPDEAERITAELGPGRRVEQVPVLRAMGTGPEIGPRPLAAEGDPLRVVLLSKIDRMKNLVGALEAVARASAEVHLTIAGPVKEPDYWDECRQAIERLGLSGRVTVHGPVEPGKVVDFLAGFDLFLLPTRGENFGHVILEALAAGLPVLISDTTRWSGIEAEGAGWVLALDDVDGFTERIDRAAALSAADREAMSASARRVAARYLDDPQALEANRTLLAPAGARVAVVNYSFPVTTQTFHHRRHRVLDDVGALTGIHYVKQAQGRIEEGSRSIVGAARPIPRRALPAALLTMARPSPLGLAVLGLMVRGLLLARSDNGEGGRAGFVWQAWNGVALGRRLRRGDASVVHAVFASAPATVALFAARVAGLPFSVEVHSPMSAQTNPRFLAFKLQRADLVVAISRYTAEMVERLAPEARIEIVHCGIDVAQRSPEPSPATDRPPVPGVLAVGSLIPKKGHDVLIRASAELAGRLPHTVGIVGGGPLWAELQDLIDSTGAPVTLLGALAPDEVAVLRASTSVGVLGSVRSADGDEDGVPVSLMEFMADGVPVVGTDVAGIAELLDDGRAGAVVRAGDHHALAAALERALTDDAWRRETTEAARHRVVAEFDNRRQTVHMASLLSTLDRTTR